MSSHSGYTDTKVDEALGRLNMAVACGLCATCDSAGKLCPICGRCGACHTALGCTAAGALRDICGCLECVTITAMYGTGEGP